MIFKKLASAILNDVMSGLKGLHSNQSMSLEQLEDDIVDVLLVDEYTKLDISTVEDIRKFYVLVLIYIYNNVIIVKDRK